MLTTAPPICAAPLTVARPLPAAPALCPIAIALPATTFPTQLCAMAAADPIKQKNWLVGFQETGHDTEYGTHQP